MKKKSMLFVVLCATLYGSDPFFDDPFGNDSFKEIYEMQKKMDEVFERLHQRIEQQTIRLNQSGANFYLPTIDTDSNSMFQDKGDHYIYDTGIKPNPQNQIDLSLQNDRVTFKAKVTQTNESNSSTHRSYQHSMSMIQRSEILPQDANPATLKMEEKETIVIVVEKKKNPSKTIPTIPTQVPPVNTPKPITISDNNTTV